MATYQTKIVQVEALQYIGTISSKHSIIEWTQGSETPAYLSDGFLYIRTTEGNMRVSPDDYVIRGLRGEHYPCKPDVFNAKYEMVEE